MNPRGGSFHGLRFPTAFVFRRLFGVLALVAVLAFARIATAQGTFYITNSPLGGFPTNQTTLEGNTNIYVLWNPTLSPQLGTNYSPLILDWTTTLATFSNLISATFPGWLGTIGPSNLNLQIITWTGAPAVFIGGTIGWSTIPIGPYYPLISLTPTNDNFANAIDLSGTAFTVTAANSWATSEIGEPVHGTNAPPIHSVWWRWTPSISGPTAIKCYTFGAVAVYTGSSLDTLQRVASVTSSQWQSLIMPGAADAITLFQAEAGVTYYIASDSPSYSFDWTLDQQLLLLSSVPTRGHVGQPIMLEATALPGNDPLSVEFLLIERFQFPPYGPPPPPQLATPGSSASTAVSAVVFGWPEASVSSTTVVLPPVNVPIYQPPSSVTLGTAYIPPYQLTWTPTNYGPYWIWARSTNSQGEVHETLKSGIDVYQANDDFADAAEIDPDAASTSFAVSSRWASAEPNEPPHRFGPATRSLWWKWTPSHSGSVRLKAVNYLYKMGGSLEVFTGSNFGNLRRIADNRATMSMSGFSGIVRLRVKAGQTYYIRSDEDSRLPRPLGRIGGYSPPDVTFTMEPVSTPLPAELNFSLIAASFYTRMGRSMVIPFGRVYGTDGRTPLKGYQYRAQLYAGPTVADLAPAGYAMSFFNNNGGYGGGNGYGDPAYDGLFYPSIVQLTNAVAGQRVFAQIRVWDIADGESFEAARANGGPTGVSPIVRVVAGSEETGPATLWGMRSFSLQNPSP